MDPVSTSAETDIEQYCVDRISHLPPELIGKILSLLPTKDAVATSVLSPSWKWLWTYITSLNFDFHRYSKDCPKPSFISFVNRVLVYRKATRLDYFGFSCYVLDDTSHLREWVSAALLVDVKELNIFIYCGPSKVLRFDLFSSKKLVKLILGVYSSIEVPDTVCLPSLEVLCLSGVGFLDHNALKRILIGCPVLEELELSNCFAETTCLLPNELFCCRKLVNLVLVVWIGFVIDVPTVVSLPSLQAMHLYGVVFRDDDSAKRLLCGCPSLQKLNIDIWKIRVLHVAAPILSYLSVSYSGVDGVGGKMVLETPSLRYLDVRSLSADSCELTELNQLVEAHLRWIGYSFGYEVVTNLIMGVSNVKTLYLCGSVIEVIVKSGCALPKFRNLSTLELNMSIDVGWALLHDLLEKSPFLETLVFERGTGLYFGQDSLENATWHTPQKVPYCLLHHLKVIRINGFRGATTDIDGNEMIQYFIGNRGALKDLVIQYSEFPGRL